MWSDAVRKALLSGKKLDTLANKLVDMACAGDIQAIKEVGDRLDGKPVQAHKPEDDQGFLVRFVE